jgi:G3E family GTPase
MRTADFRDKTLHVWFLLGTPGSGKSLLLGNHAARRGELGPCTQAVPTNVPGCPTEQIGGTFPDCPDDGVETGYPGTSGARDFIHRAWRRYAQAKDEHITVELDDLCAHRRILRDIANDPEMAASIRVEGITLCVDGLTGDRDLAGLPDLQRAVAIADRIVVTKSDLIDAERALDLSKQLKRVNPTAPVLHGYHGDLGPARLLDSCMAHPEPRNFDIERWLAEAAFNRDGDPQEFVCRIPPSTDGSLAIAPSDRGRPDEIRAFFLTHERPLGTTALATFLKLFTAESRSQVLRVKGIAHLAEQPQKPVIVHGIEHFVLPPLWLNGWPTKDHRSRFAVITKGLSRSWMASLLRSIEEQAGSGTAPDAGNSSRAPRGDGREAASDAWFQ